MSPALNSTLCRSQLWIIVLSSENLPPPLHLCEPGLAHYSVTPTAMCDRVLCDGVSVSVSLAWLIILTHQQSCVMVSMTKALALHFVSTLTWNFQSEKCEVTCITSLVPPTKHLHYRQTDRHTHMETLDMAQDSSSWQLIFWCLAYKEVKWD